MRVAWRTLALVAAFAAGANTVWAQMPLTLSEALAKARDRAPQIVSARLAIEEARARLAGTTHLQSNPEVDLAVGNRQGNGARSTDLDVGVAQSFEPGQRRSSRQAMANASLAHSTASLEEVTRATLLDTATLFLRSLQLSERVRLLDRALELADNTLQIADQRFRAGDVAILDVNIARGAAARIKSERQGVVAERIVIVGELKELLQLEDDVAPQGELSTVSSVDASLVADATSRRSEIRILEAAIQEAQAEERFGRSFARVEYGFGARYQREEQNNIILGGLTLTLPMFSTGQEPIASGRARATRLSAELEATRIRIGIEVRTALAAYQSRVEAVQLLEREALPGLDESVTLATRSFEVGQIGLAELLLIRREIIDTRVQYLDALLEAAIARVELDARAGVLR